MLYRETNQATWIRKLTKAGDILKMKGLGQTISSVEHTTDEQKELRSGNQETVSGEIQIQVKR